MVLGSAAAQDNQRYSTLTGITPANIAKLGGAWTFHVADGVIGANFEATPVIVDGVMFLPGSAGTILALDAATGALKWKYQSQRGGPRGGTNRGVAVAEGKVFSTGGGNTLIALDQKTGALLWTTKVGDRGTTVAPALYCGGLV